MRRILRVAVASCAFVGASGCWLAPGHETGRTAHNPYEAGFNAGAVSGFTELWTAQTDETTSRGVGHPVLSTDGRVYVTTTRSVYALDAATGATRWVSEVSDTYEELDTDAYVWDGQLWTNLRHSGEDWEPAYCSLTTGGCGTYGREVLGRIDGLRGSPSLGTVSVLLSEFRPLPGGGSAQYARDYFGSSRYLVTEQPRTSRLTLGGSQFFYAGPGPGIAPANEVRAFPRTGGTGWTSPIDGTEASAPVLSPDGTTVYVGTDAGTVYALGTPDGSVRWTGVVEGGVSASPALADGTLYVPTGVGTLVAFPAGGCGTATCAALWSTAEVSAHVVQPAVAAGIVFTGSADGSLYAYDANGCAADTCEPLWSAHVGSRITGAPAVSLGRVYVGTQDGRVIAYGLPLAP